MGGATGDTTPHPMGAAGDATPHPMGATPHPISATGCDGGSRPGTAPVSGGPAAAEDPGVRARPGPPGGHRAGTRLLSRARRSPGRGCSTQGLSRAHASSRRLEHKVSQIKAALKRRVRRRRLGGAARDAPCAQVGSDPPAPHRAPAPRVPPSRSHPALPPPRHRAPQGLRCQHLWSPHRSHGRSVAHPSPRGGGLLGAAAMPMHGDEPPSPPWHPGHPAGSWHPMHTSTPGPGSAGDTPRSPQPRTMGHPRDAAPPERQRWVGCGRLAPFSPSPHPFPAALGSGGQGPAKDHPVPPGLPGTDGKRSRTNSLAEQERAPAPPRASDPAFTPPSGFAISTLRPLGGPPWPPGTTSHPPRWPGDCRNPATRPRGTSHRQPPAPQGTAGPPGAAGGLHGAAPRPVLPPRGTAGVLGVAQWEMQ